MSRLEVDRVQTLHVGPATFSVAAGECAALWGPSGSGKSLLLRALADLDVHTGEVAVDGDAQSAMPGPRWRQRVGYLPTESRWWAPTVGEHFPEAVAPLPFEDLGLQHAVLAWDVERLSSGERQRAALLRLLARQPEALLLDEPTANLDAESAARVEAVLGAYRETHRAAVLWVGHDAAQRERVATSQLHIDAGEIVTA
ncbi:MAG: ABC transporter ATP-binding protein [Planctomycetota bacterium]|jgi:ABC-type iron transport system FetAB ATPase subunit